MPRDLVARANHAVQRHGGDGFEIFTKVMIYRGGVTTPPMLVDAGSEPEVTKFPNSRNRRLSSAESGCNSRAC